MHHLCQAADILWRSFLRSQQSWEFLHRCVLPRKVSIKINFFFIYNKNNKKTSLPVHHLCRAADILWRSFLRSQRCWVFPPRCVLPRKVSIKINFFFIYKKKNNKKSKITSASSLSSCRYLVTEFSAESAVLSVSTSLCPSSQSFNQDQFFFYL